MRTLTVQASFGSHGVNVADWKKLDESLITSEVCLQCGKCCKTTWLQDRISPSNNHEGDRLPYLEAMFGRSPRSFVELRGDKVAVVNWCSQLNPDLTCNIYKDRPQMCIDFNCFKEANGRKGFPEYYDHIKTLIKRIHGKEPFITNADDTS